MESTLVDKSKRFAVRVVRLCRWLQREKQDYVISRQIIRSGTSIGANIAEAQYAISKADFQSKLYIAMKESAETAYWIDLLYETDYITSSQYRSLKQDNDERKSKKRQGGYSVRKCLCIRSCLMIFISTSQV